MRPLPLVLLLRLSLLVAVAASAALIVDYQNAGDPAFCGVGSGCFAVRISPYSRLLGVPLPYVGLIAFAVLFGGSLLVQTKEHVRFLALALAAGAASALLLLAIMQFVVGATCAWCVAVDLSAIVAAASAILLAARANKYKEPVEQIINPTGGEMTAWAVAAGLAIALPFVWGRYPVVPPLPAPAQALQVPDKVTFINFSDFQCPHCRKLNPSLQPIKSKYEGRVHFDRRMMPLQSHPGALPAAQAYVCVPPDKREAAADWLYTAPDDKLTPSGVLDLAGVLGIPKNDLSACMASKDAEATIARDRDLYQALGARGLPLSLVGRRVVIGNDPERIEQSIEKELAGETLALRLEWLFAALAVIFAGAAFSTWRAKNKSAPEPPRA